MEFESCSKEFQQNFKILSLDPGFYHFGWALVDPNDPTEKVEVGSISIGNYGTDLKGRITELKRMFQILKEKITPQDVILIENQFKGHMKGLQLIMLTLFSDYANVHVIHPVHVKKFFHYQSTGYRNNKLESVEAAVKLAPSVFTTTNCDVTGKRQRMYGRIHDKAEAYMQAIFWGIVHGSISNGILTRLYTVIPSKKQIIIKGKDEAVSTSHDRESHCAIEIRDGPSADQPGQSDVDGRTEGTELRDFTSSPRHDE